MAATPMQDPQQTGGGQPSPDAASASASQAPASPEQMQLAQVFQVLRRMAQSNPILSAGLSKAAQGVQEAQTALITQPQQQPATQNPAY
jgi:hypothetical protein